MRDHRKSYITGVILALFVLAGCSIPGLDGITGGGQSGGSMGDELRGTIDQIDLRDQSFILTQRDRVSSTLINRDDSSRIYDDGARIYFDDRTSVIYEDRTYRPEDLEEGDQVAVRVSRSGDRLFATSMTVLYDVSSRAGAPNGMRTTRLQGTVQDVDTTRRTIDISQGLARSRTTIFYDANTTVEYNGRRYKPDDLERGDSVDIDVREVGPDEFLAQNINVVRNTTDSSNRSVVSTVRGTVQGIDPDRQTIDLAQTTLGTNFNPGRGDLLTLQYDANTIVEYRGDRYEPSNIERGDVVDVDVQEIGRRQFAQRIVVVRDARTLR